MSDPRVFLITPDADTTEKPGWYYNTDAGSGSKNIGPYFSAIKAAADLTKTLARLGSAPKRNPLQKRSARIAAKKAPVEIPGGGGVCYDTVYFVCDNQACVPSRAGWWYNLSGEPVTEARGPFKTYDEAQVVLDKDLSGAEVDPPEGGVTEKYEAKAELERRLEQVQSAIQETGAHKDYAEKLRAAERDEAAEQTQPVEGIEYHAHDPRSMQCGWYFRDETDNIDGNGPYPTQIAARAALLLYWSEQIATEVEKEAKQSKLCYLKGYVSSYQPMRFADGSGTFFFDEHNRVYEIRGATDEDGVAIAAAVAEHIKARIEKTFGAAAAARTGVRGVAPDRDEEITRLRGSLQYVTEEHEKAKKELKNLQETLDATAERRDEAFEANKRLIAQRTTLNEKVEDLQAELEKARVEIVLLQDRLMSTGKVTAAPMPDLSNVAPISTRYGPEPKSEEITAAELESSPLLAGTKKALPEVDVKIESTRSGAVMTKTTTEKSVLIGHKGTETWDAGCLVSDGEGGMYELPPRNAKQNPRVDNPFYADQDHYGALGLPQPGWYYTTPIEFAPTVLGARGPFKTSEQAGMVQHVKLKSGMAIPSQYILRNSPVSESPKDPAPERYTPTMFLRFEERRLHPTASKSYTILQQFWVERALWTGKPDPRIGEWRDVETLLRSATKEGEA
jgi:hypothetical protein